MPRFALLLAFSAGCRGVDPAPADLDGLARWYWANGEEAEHRDIADSIVTLHATVDGDALDGPVDGALTDLSAEDLALVGIDADPAAASGFYMVNTFNCPIDQLERVLYHLEQDELFEYDAYQRTYTSDFDAYTAREVDTLTWEVDIEASVLGNKYTENIHGGLRYIPETDFGPAILARTYLTEPANFTEGNGSFDQDYQMEVYYERAPGEIVHLYALWRQFDWGSGMDQDSEIAVRVNLNGLADWDEETEKICEEGGP